MQPTHLARRLAPAALLALACLQSTALAAPRWSNQFANAGVTFSIFEDGPLCLLPFQTAQGPRLFVGGHYTAIAGTPFRSIATFDGAQWSPVQGLVDQQGNARVAALTVMPINGTPRVIAAGHFTAPGTLDGIGYFDDQLILRALPTGPRTPFAWFAGAFAWNSPTGPELILSSGTTPQGSDYIYRYKSSGYGLMAPGVLTVTTAYASFDDGTGPALYVGVPSNGGPFNSISKWNGTTLTPITTGTGWINAMCIHDDGTGPALYIAGNGFRRLKAGIWEVVPGAPITGTQALLSMDDGTGPALYAAGQFTTVNGQPAVNIARLRNGLWEPLGSGLAGGVVKALAAFDEDGPGPRPPALYAVGKFTTAGGVSSVGIARWGEPVAPAATTQPQSQTTCTLPSSGTATFTTAATTVCTDPLTYQWQYQGGPSAISTWTPLLPGANSSGGTFTLNAQGPTSPSLAVSHQSPTWPGSINPYQFRCIITNSCGSLTSATATLTLLGRCSPADIADGQGEPLFFCAPGVFNPVGPDGGDFDCFFNSYFAPSPDNAVCDIAYGDGEPLPPFGPTNGFNPGVDGGDFDCFFNFYFAGCP